MKLGVWVGAALAAVGLCAFAPPAEAAGELALRRVLLSSGGVGYFEYEADVEGDANLPLEVRVDQIDDVLKSIVVFDDQGTLGEVTLPGREALTEVFRDLPFDQSALDSMAALVGALRGAEVRVETAGETFEGRIVSVAAEQAEPSEGETITRHRLTVLSNDGALRQVILEDVVSLTFLDETLQQQIDTAAAALLEQQEGGVRELAIHLQGEGPRRVRVGYVVGVPLWKATYRLVLGDEQATTSVLQGFAVVENRSGEDWENVDLTLTSGSPVTFRQALYDTYYVDRPEVPVDLVNRVLPRLDEGATEIAERALFAMAAPGAAAEAADLANPASIVAAEAMQTISQVQYRLPLPVSIEDGQSALLPVIEVTLPTKRVSIYQPDVAPRHPLAAAELTNDTGADLPPGAVTVLERGDDGALTYLGDARLAPLPAGESRLAIFAVDERVTIDREESRAQVLTLATIANGILTLTETQQRETLYTIEGAAGEPRTVILEHPRVEGYTISLPDGGAEVIEQTERYYRIRTDVAAGETKEVRVVLERPILRTIRIADLSRAQTLAYASSADLPEAVRAAFAHVAELQAAVADKESALEALEAELARIAEEQARIRENLMVVPAGSDLAEQYLTTLGEQESRIAALRVEIEAAESALAEARRALAEAIRGLSL